MSAFSYRSEIRDSTIRSLIDKVRKQNFNEYLLSVRLERVRQFRGVQINFDFPVTALVGPNGSGKSTILGAAACLYNSVEPKNIFRKSRVGDDAMDDWLLQYELVSKSQNPTGSIKAEVTFRGNRWDRTLPNTRVVKIIGITRTVPAADSPLFNLRRKLTVHGTLKKGHKRIEQESIGGIDHIKAEAEKILGRSLKDFQLLRVRLVWEKGYGGHRRKVKHREILADGRQVLTFAAPTRHTKVGTRTLEQLIFVGQTSGVSYSEFNFGSGEASVLHVVADIESVADGSLVLIEELENGLHPLAVCRMVDYLISVSARKQLQILFTTHSDYALAPLPSEAIWASLDGTVQQGKLSIEMLRAVSGRIDKRLAVFVEDVFAQSWVESILRERLGESAHEIGVYALTGDGNAVKTHYAHMTNPAVDFRSVCIIDGDSRQKEDSSAFVFRLSGTVPELTVFNDVVTNIKDNIALLTVASQRPADKQHLVAAAIEEVSRTNRDPHLLFNQVGLRLGFVPEAVIRGAFLTVWIMENASAVDEIAAAVRTSLEIPREQSPLYVKSMQL